MGRPWGLVAIALVLTWVLGVSMDALPPGWGEPWLLRWARTLGEHPVRTALALWLALWALRPAGRTPEP